MFRKRKIATKKEFKSLNEWKPTMDKPYPEEPFTLEPDNYRKLTPIEQAELKIAEQALIDESEQR